MEWNYPVDPTEERRLLRGRAADDGGRAWAGGRAAAQLLQLRGRRGKHVLERGGVGAARRGGIEAGGRRTRGVGGACKLK